MIWWFGGAYIPEKTYWKHYSSDDMEQAFFQKKIIKNIKMKWFG